MFSRVKINLSKQRVIVENLFLTLIKLNCITEEQARKIVPKWEVIDKFIEKHKEDSEESIF